MTMKYDHPEIIEPALEVIKRIDPELHDRMRRSNWDVHVITRLTPDERRLDDPNGTEYQDFRDNPDAEMMTSFYVTGRPTDAALEVIRSHLRIYGAPLASVVAADLVHEFAHHEGGDEVASYQASYEFASRLPGGGRIAENSANGIIQSIWGRFAG